MMMLEGREWCVYRYASVRSRDRVRLCVCVSVRARICQFENYSKTLR